MKLTSLKRKDVELTGLIDTGYDGFLLLPYDLFVNLNIPLLPKDEFRFIESADGTLHQLIVGLAQIQIAGQVFPIVEVETIKSLDEVLIGRQLLRELDVALLGKKETLCLVNRI